MRASFFASTSATVVVPRRPRFRFVVLLLRMCCLKACPLRNFPFFVRLKRLAAPRWVLSLIFFTFDMVVLLLRFGRGRRRGFRPATAPLGAPAENRVHLVALEPRQRFRNREVGELFD